MVVVVHEHKGMNLRAVNPRYCAKFVGIDVPRLLHGKRVEISVVGSIENVVGELFGYD
jgi:hypothetical protein